MEKDVRVGSVETLVNIIDWKPINDAISKAVGKQVECRVGNAFIGDVSAIFDEDYGLQVRDLIIDKECCGVSTIKENFFCSQLNDGKPFSINLFKGIGFYSVDRINDDGSKSVAMFPSFYFDIDRDDVIQCLTGEKIPLYQYMAHRYGYNGRIQNNEMGILKLIYHKDIEEGKFDWQEILVKEIAD